ncbi:MAG: GNAT family N-acetyltransferase [Caulobacter sp.]|nr:GNAT family N-acetyltransferase [Caulobacter sp.]
MHDIITLEDVSARAWPALHTARLGGWRLNASTGHTGRANTCWAIEPPDRPVEAALAAVEAWYAGHDLPPKFKTVDGATAPDDLADRLIARGYRPNTETLVMTGPVGGTNDGVVLGAEPDAAFLSVMLETLYRDRADADERIATLRRIAPPVLFARLDVDGRPAAIGACAIDGDWAGVSVMRTSADYRRAGLASRIVAALLGEASAAGATHSYLQVEAANTSAIALYRGLGFTEIYRYRYWSR